MPIEQLVIYIVLGAIFFVKFVADNLKRHREAQMAERAPEPTARELDERWADPFVQTTQRAAEPQPAPAPAPSRRAPERPAAPGARGEKRKPPARARRPAPLQPALRHRIALDNHAELRRTVELMAILGPPRALAPYDS